MGEKKVNISGQNLASGLRVEKGESQYDEERGSDESGARDNQSEQGS